jgi:signal transduction histidine kinase
MSLAIAFYINSSLQPLRQLNQKAASIKSDNLSQAQLSLTQAPSEVKELAQTLNHLLTRLSLSWEREREFTSNVSHELRTPLTLVYGYLQSVLRRGDNLTPIQQESLSIAASEAERTIQILQGLLDLARGESGNLSFQIESLPLQNLVLEVVMMARKSSDRSIILHAPDAPIIAKFDPSRLQQVLVNLLDNALKYSPENTCIIVHLCQDNNHAIMQVTDQGYGIPLQHQARIFERFYRVDESRTQATGGTGLGLAIVKMLVEGMGGEIAVESKLGEGTTFSVSLPLSDVN